MNIRSRLFNFPWDCLTTSQVQGLNTQWQKYDSSREDYIRGLCQRLKESPDQGLVPALGSVSSVLLQQEISRLNTLLEEKISECEQLEREVASVRRKSKERIQTLEQQVSVLTYFWLTCPQLGKILLPPHTHLFTYSFPFLQVLIYTDDFKSERADRERAQGQIDDLKEQVYQLKRQLHKQVRGPNSY